MTTNMIENLARSSISRFSRGMVGCAAPLRPTRRLQASIQLRTKVIRLDSQGKREERKPKALSHAWIIAALFYVSKNYPSSSPKTALSGQTPPMDSARREASTAGSDGNTPKREFSPWRLMAYRWQECDRCAPVDSKL
jgi:hypothetical protein